MWHAADLNEKLRDAGDYHFTGLQQQQQPKFDWDAFKPKRDAYIQKLSDSYERNLVREHVDVYHGIGVLRSPTTVRVTPLSDGDAEPLDLHADHICIATGGRPVVPDDATVPGASLGIDSDGFFALKTQPRRAAVVGAGYIAVELAGVLNALGTETHLIIRGERVLRTFDQDLQDVLTPWMEHSGVRIHKESRVVRVDRVGPKSEDDEDDGGGAKVVQTDRGERIEVDVVLWAIGRRANTEGIGLEEVGVRLNDRGDVVVDEYQNTSVKGVTSIGDVQGKALLTPVAIAAGRRLANRLFGPEEYKDQKLDYENIPTVVFSWVFVLHCSRDCSTVSSQPSDHWDCRTHRGESTRKVRRCRQDM